MKKLKQNFAIGILTFLTISASAVTHYVDVNSANPVSPYLDWSTAAMNIQDAVDAADAGDLVLVTNGVYQTGGRAVYGSLTNRVALAKPVMLQSVNGPEVTIIQGFQLPGTTNGDGAIRCVYLTNGASLSGFTLTNGATRLLGDTMRERNGGGVWCESSNALLFNCFLIGNSAGLGTGAGGGIYNGTASNCVFSGNAAGSGGAAYGSILGNCVLSNNIASNNGGGASSCILSDSLIIGNSAVAGGGANGCTLYNCTITKNAATRNASTGLFVGTGGGVNASTLFNCTLSGNSATNSGGAASSGALYNCTLSNNSAIYFGGGAFFATLSNCVVSDNAAASGGGATLGASYNSMFVNNTATRLGGGANSNTLVNCLLAGNSAPSGGGAFGGSLKNCTVVGNYAFTGGGVVSGTLGNCIVYDNTGRNGTNYFACALDYCCTTPLPPTGIGNFTAKPELADQSHLSGSSPCRAAGSPIYTVGVDIDGETWGNPPSIGCDEYSLVDSSLLSVAIKVADTNIALGFASPFATQINGSASSNFWDFGDGTYASNQPFLTHIWDTTGDFQIIMRVYNASNPNGVGSSITVHVAAEVVHYVAQDNPSPAAPYLSWATAATNIQNALDVAFPGSIVLVSNGVYASGGRMIYGNHTNRIAVTRPILVKSVNGPDATTIQGYQIPGQITGYEAVRCAYLTDGAILSGFTLTGGQTGRTPDVSNLETVRSGGGVWCESTNGVITNCVVTANLSFELGGGAYSGTLNNCVILDNTNLNISPYGGGGASLSVMNRCLIKGNRATDVGGGAYNATLNNCVVTGNSAIDGAGAYGGFLNQCLVISNVAASSGGGISGGKLLNCTVTGNIAGSQGGGVVNCFVTNSIVYFNAAAGGPNFASGLMLYSCTTPAAQANLGNIANAPSFVDPTGDNRRLQSNSPCIDAGADFYVANFTDLDGRPREVGGKVDMGAYEYQGPGMGEFIGWLENHTLATDGSADFTDADGDLLNNWQEWKAGTDPINNLSVLKMGSPVPDSSGVIVTWQSMTDKTYSLDRATDLSDQPVFSNVASNIVGQAGTTTYTDTTATNGGSFFYRVGVQE